MHHAIYIGQDLDKGAEIGSAHDPTGIDMPNLRRFG